MTENDIHNGIDNEMVEKEQPMFNETSESVQTTQNQPKKRKTNLFQLIFYIGITAAVVVLYILHFLTPKQEVFVPKEFDGKPGSGEIVYINLDTINANYELVKILTGDIEAETRKQETIFQNKEESFKKKYAQFQENYQKGILTQVQIENAQMQLEQEYAIINAEKEKVFNDLQNRQTTALIQIYDSLQMVIKRINLERNASFVITYQANSPFLMHADPSKEITDQVLFELNKPYQK
ncbi:MAG TPA: OmpH family outer membrane protein [Bacteroidales bacterium]|nr:OmpH family outer membrane protein [Bacteroidales bacterium]